MTLYKLTDEKWETYNHTKWGPGVTHTAPGTGKLCSAGWIHAYTDPYLSVLMNPIHAAFPAPVLWLAEGQLEKNDCGLKCGTRSLTTISIMDLPKISTTQKIAFSIFCALEVFPSTNFRVWAKNWLSGKGRSYAAAAAATATAAAAAAATATADAAAAATAAGKILNFPAIIKAAMEIE